MKKLIAFIPILLYSLISFGQPEVQRSSTANTPRDPHLTVQLSFRTPVFADTTAANAVTSLDSVGKMIFTRDVMAHWSRVGYPKRWIRIGTTTSLSSSSSILVSGSGSDADPFVPSLIPSAQNNNAIVINADGVYVPTQVQNGLIEGGILTWVTGYTYDVSPARYGIQNIVYNTLQDQVTFPNADTLPRFDQAYVDVDEDVGITQGVASETPVEPSYDPLTQVPLAFIFIDSNSTAPPDINEEYIYKNDDPGEWTATASNARIVDNSTNNPYSAPRTIEATLARSNDSIGFKAPTSPIMSDFTVITFKLRSKATWSATQSIRLQFYNGTTAVGLPVFVSNNVYGFVSSNTAVYQTITIRLSDFGSIPIVTNLRITVQASASSTIGFYADDIRLLGGDGVIIPQNGDDWHVGGNTLASTGRIGPLTPNNFEIITGNDVKARFNNASSDFELLYDLWMRGANPGVSFLLNTFANSDYTIRRVGTTMTLNTAGDYQLKFAGANFYSFDKNNGHIWEDSLSTTLAQLLPTGQYRLYNYGDNLFTGTATRWLAVDVNGNVIEQAPPSLATPTLQQVFDTEVGGSVLTKLDTINTSTFNIRMAGTGGSGILRIQNSGSGGGLVSLTASGTAGFFNSSTGAAISAFGGNANSFSISTANNNDVAAIMTLQRSLTSGSAAVGIGTGIYFRAKPGLANNTLRIESVMTDVTSTDEESKMDIYLMNSGVSVEYLRSSLYTDGNWQWQAYGSGTFTGTPTFGLAVDASGNVIEVAVGSGMTNPMTTTNDIIYSADNSGTPARLAAGTANQVLAMNGAGTALVWVTPGTGGTVTSVDLSGADFTFSGNPITTSGTIAVTLATVNGNVGTFGSSTAIPVITYNAKGLATAVTTAAVIAPAGTLTGTTLNATVVTSSLTTVGTIGAGTWQGTAIATGFGGTPTGGTVGQVLRKNSSTNYDYSWATPGTGGTVTTLLGGTTGMSFTTPTTTPTLTGTLNVANGGTGQTSLQAAMNALAGGVTNGRVLRGNGVNVVLAQLNLATDVTGALLPINGGTGLTGALSGRIMVGDGSAWQSIVPTGSNGIVINIGAGTLNISQQFNPAFQTLTDLATTIWNVTNGANAVWTNTGTNRTLSITNPVIGHTYLVRHIQGAGGSHTISTYPTGTRWPNGGAAPTLSTAVGAIDIFTFTWDGTNYWADYKLNY